MKHTAFALVLFATAACAQAGDAGSSSLLRCGVNLGGKSLTYDAGEPSKSRQEQRFTQARGAATAAAEPRAFAPAAGAADRQATALHASDTASDQRLPANLTLATIGCSW